LEKPSIRKINIKTTGDSKPNKKDKSKEGDNFKFTDQQKTLDSFLKAG
jgi:hypothetical protein